MKRLLLYLMVLLFGTATVQASNHLKFGCDEDVVDMKPLDSNSYEIIVPNLDSSNGYYVHAYDDASWNDWLKYDNIIAGKDYVESVGSNKNFKAKSAYKGKIFRVKFFHEYSGQWNKVVIELYSGTPTWYYKSSNSTLSNWDYKEMPNGSVDLTNVSSSDLFVLGPDQTGNYFVEGNLPVNGGKKQLVNKEGSFTLTGASSWAKVTLKTTCENGEFYVEATAPETAPEWYTRKGKDGVTEKLALGNGVYSHNFGEIVAGQEFTSYISGTGEFKPVTTPTVGGGRVEMTAGSGTWTLGGTTGSRYADFTISISKENDRWYMQLTGTPVRWYLNYGGADHELTQGTAHSYSGTLTATTGLQLRKVVGTTTTQCKLGTSYLNVNGGFQAIGSNGSTPFTFWAQQGNATAWKDVTFTISASGTTIAATGTRVDEWTVSDGTSTHSMAESDGVFSFNFGADTEFDTTGVFRLSHNNQSDVYGSGTVTVGSDWASLHTGDGFKLDARYRNVTISVQNSADGTQWQVKATGTKIADTPTPTPVTGTTTLYFTVKNLNGEGNAVYIQLMKEDGTKLFSDDQMNLDWTSDIPVNGDCKVSVSNSDGVYAMTFPSEFTRLTAKAANKYAAGGVWVYNTVIDNVTVQDGYIYAIDGDKYIAEKFDGANNAPFSDEKYTIYYAYNNDDPVIPIDEGCINVYVYDNHGVNWNIINRPGLSTGIRLDELKSEIEHFEADSSSDNEIRKAIGADHVIRITFPKSKGSWKFDYVVFNDGYGTKSDNQYIVDNGVYFWGDRRLPFGHYDPETGKYRRLSDTNHDVDLTRIYVRADEFGDDYVAEVDDDGNLTVWSKDGEEKSDLYLHLVDMNDEDGEYYKSGIRGNSAMYPVVFDDVLYYCFPSANMGDNEGHQVTLEVNRNDQHDGGNFNATWKDVCSDATHADDNHIGCTDADRIMLFPDDVTYKNNTVYYRSPAEPKSVFEETRPDQVFLVIDGIYSERIEATSYDEETGVYNFETDDAHVDYRNFICFAVVKNKTTHFYQAPVYKYSAKFSIPYSFTKIDIDKTDMKDPDVLMETVNNWRVDTPWGFDGVVSFGWLDQKMWITPIEDLPFQNVQTKSIKASHHTGKVEELGNDHILKVATHQSFPGQNCGNIQASLQLAPGYRHLAGLPSYAAHQPVAYYETGQQSTSHTVKVLAPTAGVYNLVVEHTHATDLFAKQTARSGDITVKPTIQSIGMTINGWPIKVAEDGSLSFTIYENMLKNADGSDRVYFEDEDTDIVWGANRAFLDYDALVVRGEDGDITPESLAELADVKVWFKDNSINGDNSGIEYRPHGAKATDPTAGYSLYSNWHNISLKKLSEATDPSVSFIVEQNGIKSDPQTVNFNYNPVPTSVDEIEAADDAEAVYYDLLGNRIQNPDKGIYIRVVGKTATKIVL